MNNLYQTNIAAPYNRYSMKAAGTLGDHSGGGFNDGAGAADRLSVLEGLHPREGAVEQRPQVARAQLQRLRVVVHRLCVAPQTLVAQRPVVPARAARGGLLPLPLLLDRALLLLMLPPPPLLQNTTRCCSYAARPAAGSLRARFCC